ncbi:Gfo/Idh/MocA family protein [Pelagicoccus mobilis]|uniref:Gfo/Idh/MocA family oxidoreductase n=1 Tax=Pelagicoccus mobilis TaxID=415221 RepID=A0A934RWJ8_9BACT|nr:Gfo/Idh/MocA family oxidoreductase [Pelagicoccus mobilis]MBK1879070.1 Gfo/Idh/MocA family oxidoreductase [Pelagicoccus mobilis]
MSLNRRSFIRRSGTAAAALAFPSIIPSYVLGANSPSKRITLGFIGMGGQGTQNNLTGFLGLPDTQVLSVCDAFLSRAHRAKAMVDERYKNNDCRAYQDFRQIINDPAIDAVVISTPDHWHVPMSLMALEAGKDVFCEKPTQSINEGRVLTDAFAKSDRVFQAGIEDRSTIHFHKMVEWVKNGAIGELERVEVIMPKGRDYALEEPSQIPEDLDWNLWQGPAPFTEYSQTRAGAGQWRQISMYSKGTILDIGTHLADTAQIGVNDPDVCPIEVSGTGYIPQNRMTNVPTEYDLTYKYGNGVEMNIRNGEGLIWDPDSCFLEFQGSKGWVRRRTWTAGLEASDKQILRTKYAKGESKHWPLPKNEWRNFIDNLKVRSSKTSYPAVDLHHMSTTLHMGVMSIQLGRKLKWNPKKEAFVNDKEANQMRFLPTARDWEKES